MPGIIESVESAFRNETQMNGYTSTTMTKIDVLENLASSKIFSCITHGRPTEILTSDGSFTITDLSSLPNSAYDDLKLVCITACLAGAGGAGATNLVNALSNKGADVVIGYTVEIKVDAANYWTEQFMINIAEGYNVAEAIGLADAALEQNMNISADNKKTITGSGNRYVVGSQSIIPCN